MDDRDQELFRILRSTAIFYGVLLLLIWVYAQLTNSWENEWLKSVMVLLIILLIFSGSTKFLMENKTLMRVFYSLQQYLGKHQGLLKVFHMILGYFKIKKKFRKYYFIILFFTLLITILWVIMGLYLA